MLTLTKALMMEGEFARLAAAVEAGGCPALMTGLSQIHRAHAAAALSITSGRPVVVLTEGEPEARAMAGDIGAFTGEPVSLLLSRQLVFHNAEGVSRDTERGRLGALHELLQGRAGVLVADLAGFCQRTMPPDRLEKLVFQLNSGGEYDPDEICERLNRAGYSRCELVEGPGQMARRGGILDVFSPNYPQPFRVEFFGDEIDSLGFFDTSSQRREDLPVDSVTVVPVAETLPALAEGGNLGLYRKLEALRKKAEKAGNTQLSGNIMADIDRLTGGRAFPAVDRYMELIYPFASGLDYVPPDALVLLCEPGRLRERAKSMEKAMAEENTALAEKGLVDINLAKFSADFTGVLERLSDMAVIMLDDFTRGSYPLRPRTVTSLNARRLPSYGGSLQTAASDVVHYMKADYRTVILCPDERKAGILAGYLERQGVTPTLDYALKELPGQGELKLAIGGVSAGFDYPGSRLAVIAEGQLTAGAMRSRIRKKAARGQKLESFADLSPGDLVVHDIYGIGRFEGIVPSPVEGNKGDYVKITYAGDDKLYVPAMQLDLVTKFVGGDGETVRLSKMGGSDWQRAKSRAKGAAKELARGLIAIQAERSRKQGYAFSKDSAWQDEFESSFEYLETDDQLRCVREIKEDMERPQPMDRLLCGDVGFGKTEVALRAVMKCVLEGKQAAILVPTTVLAQQHFNTCSRRFGGYPVEIDVLSRYKTPTEMKKSLARIAAGEIDIVIGTHRLLQPDIKFKDLGLLVVDEEQRFGVQHKERIKEMSRQVDVLTLTATPIPRTLNMALTGIRDLSTIEEPPRDRQPVLTFVIEHDWDTVREVIKRETDRGGQVYYIHNRIDNIQRVAARLRELLPGLNIDYAHGKLDEDELYTVMERMSAGETQVLVCTTIIETGIDIPNVNTLIIEDADKLGLAQLHQLRGRVGRSNRRAYAYFTFRRGKVLSDVAEKRLGALREFAEFNSGLKIAMRDLEIRGAGNLLGAEQSGHITSVGYDMYMKLLEEAVLEEKGQKPPARSDCSAELTVKAGIPESYVASAEQRMDLYRRIAMIRTEADADDMTDELIDRFGDPPRPVNTLIYIALMRGEAGKAGIREIAQRGSGLRFTMDDFDYGRIAALSSGDYKGRIKVNSGTVPSITLSLRPGKDVIDEAMGFIRAYTGRSRY